MNTTTVRRTHQRHKWPLGPLAWALACGLTLLARAAGAAEPPAATVLFGWRAGAHVLVAPDGSMAAEGLPRLAVGPTVSFPAAGVHLAAVLPGVVPEPVGQLATGARLTVIDRDGARCEGVVAGWVLAYVEADLSSSGASIAPAREAMRLFAYVSGCAAAASAEGREMVWAAPAGDAPAVVAGPSRDVTFEEESVLARFAERRWSALHAPVVPAGAATPAATPRTARGASAASGPSVPAASTPDEPAPAAVAVAVAPPLDVVYAAHDLGPGLAVATAMLYDVDADGIETREMAVFLLRSDGGSAPRATVAFPFSAPAPGEELLGAADLDGDGRPELLLRDLDRARIARPGVNAYDVDLTIELTDGEALDPEDGGCGC